MLNVNESVKKLYFSDDKQDLPDELVLSDFIWYNQGFIIGNTSDYAIWKLLLKNGVRSCKDLYDLSDERIFNMKFVGKKKGESIIKLRNRLKSWYVIYTAVEETLKETRGGE